MEYALHSLCHKQCHRQFHCRSKLFCNWLACQWCNVLIDMVYALSAMSIMFWEFVWWCNVVYRLWTNWATLWSSYSQRVAGNSAYAVSVRLPFRSCIALRSCINTIICIVTSNRIISWSDIVRAVKWHTKRRVKSIWLIWDWERCGKREGDTFLRRRASDS